jgi:hypothetical protein
MARAFVCAMAAAVALLMATPALAANGDATVTTPDGVGHVCQVDYPGASFEANLEAAGYTERFSIVGTVNAQDMNLVLLCQAEP